VPIRHSRAAFDARRPSTPSGWGRPRRCVAPRRARRTAFCVPFAAHSVDHAARFLRHLLLVCDSPAAHLRAGRPARRRARLWLVVRRAGSRSGRGERGSRAAYRKNRAPWPDAIVVDWGIWAGDSGIWIVPLVLADVWLPRPDR